MVAQRRDRKILVCLTDAEFDHLNTLVATYSLEGHRATKSFLVRYALKKLPHQQGFDSFASGLELESAC